MGRINRWKGQKLLVEAANVLAAKGLSSISFLIVGSAPPGQQHFVSELMHVISTSSVAANIHVLDFQESIWPLWDACDIAVVPSTEPEPFGMVALEAMAARKPVIAAAHGGLVDIVADGTTGILVTPNDANALAQAIARLAGDVSERSRMGQAGWETLRKQFTTARYIERFEELYGRAQSN
jgi:glycosyltransferase involved in cell wall biosynthesis